MSYVFNSEFLGRLVRDAGNETPAGRVERVRSPATVFLFADGYSAGQGNRAGYAVESFYRPDETLYDYWRLWSHRQFDHVRHRNRINVVFVDGHAETLMLPNPLGYSGDLNNRGDLDRAGVSKGIYNSN
jgi:prepilin-type processing-associated H-X9-DG protein